MKTVKVTLTIGERLAERLKGLSELTGRSRADLIEGLCEKGMNVLTNDMRLHLGQEAARARGSAPES